MAGVVRYERLSSRQDDVQHFAATGTGSGDYYGGSRSAGVAPEDDEEIELGHDNDRLRYCLESDSADNGDDGDPRYSHNSGAANSLEATAGRPNPVIPLPGSRIMQMAIGTLISILFYLMLSIGLTFYQKALIHKLNFPLTIVCYHLMIKNLLAYAFRAIYKSRTGKSRVQLDWRLSVRRMAPTGIASGIDIGFSQWGLQLVSVSLYTMAKSSAIVFILFFAILLGLEKKSISLVFIVGLIASGLLMFTYKSTQFNALGFVFILIASLSSGVRWSLAQLVMQKSKLGLHNPIDMIFYMQPWMLASLLPLSVAIEGQRLYDVLRDLPILPIDKISTTLLSVTLGAVLAFCMEVSEFLVLSKTSSLTLSIAGIFKDICQVTLAVIFNGDKLSSVNILGLMVLLGGILLHVVHKYMVLAKQAQAELATFGDDAGHGGYHEAGGGLTESQAATDDFNETIVNGSAGSLSRHKHTSQTVPLLEVSDSDESLNEDLNSTDVIFDVLKRRDATR